MNRDRIIVAILSMSAVGFVGLISQEGYVEQAMIPTKGDRPTVGFGSTFHEDGTPVKLGDRVTPERAMVKAKAHIDKDEKAFRASLQGVSLHQAEFDVYMDFFYQYGSGTWNRSSMRRHILAGEYRQACDALLRYKYAAGYDCSTPNNKRCSGVWLRQLDRHTKCMEAQ